MMSACLICSHHAAAGSIRVPDVGWEATRGRAEAGGGAAAGGASAEGDGRREASDPGDDEVMPDVARLRTKVMYEAIQEALARATKWMYEHEPVRFVHASVQGNHLHLLVEASSNEALSRAMKGFLVSCAKRLNKIAGRQGSVFADRFHTRTLTTPMAVRNAIRYTLAYASHCTSLSMEKSDPIAVGDPRL
jgi:REP element-mobilizing transposase RayT